MSTLVQTHKQTLQGLNTANNWIKSVDLVRPYPKNTTDSHPRAEATYSPSTPSIPPRCYRRYTPYRWHASREPLLDACSWSMRAHPFSSLPWSLNYDQLSRTGSTLVALQTNHAPPERQLTGYISATCTTVAFNDHFESDRPHKDPAASSLLFLLAANT